MLRKLSASATKAKGTDSPLRGIGNTLLVRKTRVLRRHPGGVTGHPRRVPAVNVHVRCAVPGTRGGKHGKRDSRPGPSKLGAAPDSPYAAPADVRTTRKDRR
ncbi:hypothetical protein GCM10010406_53400 [Streptomyces thermolineatus]|uniref:Uncharacterized protein n=1 Tax=Streptomyces thermolineatus TaxID=44033 RepID=A0ABN3MY47_9ACTN